MFQVCVLDKCFEITSLVGTVCKDGAHLHVTLGDSEGNTVAGHVFGDLTVQTTAEVILGEVCGVQFKREFDEETGYSELVVSKH
jgi:predicted DNA-binding protein with PD1-like motif